MPSTSSASSVLEWSKAFETWQMLSPAGAIDDPVFATALPVEALVAAGKTDDAMALGLIAKGNRVIDARVAQGRAEALAGAILQILEARGLDIPEAERQEVLGCSDGGRLSTWLTRAATASRASALLEQDETPRR